MTDNTKSMLRQLLDLPPEQQDKEYAEISAFLHRCEKFGSSYSGFFDREVIQAGRLFIRIKRSKRTDTPTDNR